MPVKKWCRFITHSATDLEKEYKRLVGFAKTRILQPGETQTLMMRFTGKQLASFSEDSHTWIVEKGSYGLMLGNSSDKLNLQRFLEVPDDEELEQLDEICPLQEKLDLIHLSEEMQEKLCTRSERGGTGAGSTISF